MDGLVAAGALATDELRSRGVERIPLLKVDGETILNRVCRCLIEGGGCQKVHVLAPGEVPLPDHHAVCRGEYSGDLVSDVLNCVRNDTAGEGVLISSGDLPLLTPEAVSAVVDAAKNSGADVVYPVAERQAVEERFAGSKRTYLRLRGQTVTGGNVFWLGRDWILRNGELLAKLFEHRKSPPALAKIFGVGFLIRVVLGLASLDYLERHLGGVVRAKLHAPVLPFPELVVDLDKPADLDLFTPYLDPWEN
ncbi:nucleotidyltransferase family protein [bacterium]|nr:nucleotidyltransferase family protein [bacterium]